MFEEPDFSIFVKVIDTQTLNRSFGKHYLKAF